MSTSHVKALFVLAAELIGEGEADGDVVSSDVDRVDAILSECDATDLNTIALVSHAFLRLTTAEHVFRSQREPS